MLLTILHLSDLHRSPDAPVSNEMLLSCLLEDFKRQRSETPVIPKCDVTVITGDIILGAPLNDSNFAETIVKQYNEANSFLVQLGEELFDGDNGKILLVPGNHDICWQFCQKSMELIENKDRINVPKLLDRIDSPYRWAWSDLQLYRIKNLGLYKERLRFFKNFFDHFYRTTGYNYSLEDNEQAVNFIVEDKNALFTGFSSLYGNDCYDHRGRIFADSIARNGLSLRKSRYANIALKIAFWHHSLESSEYGVDHLNRNEVLPLLIDQGYCMGLHGHKHMSEVISYASHLNPESFVPIISCGSLCGSPYAIPTGYRRQYNIIEVNDIQSIIRVHVREWFGNTTLTAARLQEFEGKSWLEKNLPLLKEKTNKESHVLDSLSLSIEKAEMYLRDGKFEEALSLLRKLPENVPIVHSLILESLHALGKWDELIGAIKNPANSHELSILVDALCKKKAFDFANIVISERENDTATFDKKLVERLKQRLQVERKIGLG